MNTVKTWSELRNLLSVIFGGEALEHYMKGLQDIFEERSISHYDKCFYTNAYTKWLKKQGLL